MCGPIPNLFLGPVIGGQDTDASKAFFEKYIGSSGRPEKANINKRGANLAGWEEVNKTLPEDEKIEIRQVKYLNNMIEQYLRGDKTNHQADAWF